MSEEEFDFHMRRVQEHEMLHAEETDDLKEMTKSWGVFNVPVSDPSLALLIALCAVADIVTHQLILMQGPMKGLLSGRTVERALDELRAASISSFEGSHLGEIGAQRRGWC